MFIYGDLYYFHTLILKRDLPSVPVSSFTIKFLTLQNTTEFISINEALLVRFRTDDTISNKGFMALFVAVDQDNGENYGGSEDEDADEENL